MSNFWRDELTREINARLADPAQRHPDIPNVLKDEPDEPLLKLMTRAHREQMDQFIPEIQAHQRRVHAARAITKHTAAGEARKRLQLQRSALRIRLRMIDLGIEPLTPRERLALELGERRRQTEGTLR